MWDEIDFRYMTEESEGEDCINQHKLVWRSRGLSLY